MWKTVIYENIPQKFRKLNYWDSPADVHCLQCKQDVLSKDTVHNCKRLVWLTIGLCSCYRLESYPGSSVNLNEDRPFKIFICKRCKLLGKPIQEWSEAEFKRYAPYGLLPAPKELEWST